MCVCVCFEGRDDCWMSLQHTLLFFYYIQKKGHFEIGDLIFIPAKQDIWTDIQGIPSKHLFVGGIIMNNKAQVVTPGLQSRILTVDVKSYFNKSVSVNYQVSHKSFGCFRQALEWLPLELVLWISNWLANRWTSILLKF